MPVLLLISSVVVSFGLNLFIIPSLLRLSHWKGWYDEVDHRKIHKGNIPRLGGFGIFVSFILGLVIFYILKHFIYPDFPVPGIFSLWPILAGLAIIHVLGLIDDFVNIKPWLKVVVQLAAAGIVAFFGNTISVIAFPAVGITLNLGPFSYAFTILWIIGLSNAVNLLDGLDGLAGGTIAIAALFISSVAVLQHNYIAAVAGIILFGSLVGFLVFNFPPAKLFMGDSGSLFIGFFIAVMPLFGWQVPSKTSTLFIITITMAAVPIIDTVGSILRRIRNRQPVHSPDKAHIHHKLIDLGLQPKGVLAIVYSIILASGIVCLVSVIFDHVAFAVLVPILWTCIIVFFSILDRLYKNEKKQQS